MNNTLAKIEVKTYLDWLNDKQKIERLLDKSQKGIARNEVKVTNDNTSCSTISGIVLAAKDNVESTVLEIIDLDESVLNINDKIERGEASKRSGNTIQRKLLAKIKKRNLYTYQGKHMKQEACARLLRSLWYGTRFNQVSNTKEYFSGRNKEEHGLVLVNDRVFCNLCNVPIMKIAQYLLIFNHQKVCESKRIRTNRNNLNPIVHNENSVSIGF